MRKQSIVIDAVNLISDYITLGLEINVKTCDEVKMVSVRDPRNGDMEELAFKVPCIGVSQFNNETNEYLEKHSCKEPIMKPVTSLPDKAMPTVDTIGQKKHNSRWWSRFHLEKNIMRMTLLALQDRYPAQESFPQQVFAARLARMMGWKTPTARKHITRAAKMGIISRAVIGTTYHITGINDLDVKTAQDTVADRDAKPEYMPLPGEDCDEDLDKARPAFYRELLDEGKPALELEREKALNQQPQPQTIRFDESLLP